VLASFKSARAAHNLSTPLSILRLVVSTGETSAPYNQFSLALSSRQNITMCTYFKPSVPVPKEIALFEGNGSPKGFIRALRVALHAKRYDLIHAHSPHVGLLFLLVKLSMRTWLLPPTIYTVHNSYQNYKARNQLMLYPVFAGFRSIVCCSMSTLASLPRVLRWLAGNRIHTVQNGVDLERIDRAIAARPNAARKNPFRVVAVGRLIEMKRPTTVLNAFHLGTDQEGELVLVGEGHLRAELSEQIQRLGLQSRVRMTGLIPRNDVFALMSDSDLCVSGSVGEGLPMAILEAMACRCPVVLSDILPHREIADGADFIPLVRPDDTRGFAEEIRRFQAMSSSERSTLGARCRRLVEERFSLESMHAGYERAYQRLLNENHRRPAPKLRPMA